MRIAGGAERGGRGRPCSPAIGAKRWKIVVYEPLNARLCATASPSIGPREANFFPYLSIQLTAFRGSFLGLGITRFRLARKTPLSPWGGAACAPVPAGRLHPRVIGRGEFHLAGQLVTVVRHPRAVVARRTPIRLPPPPRRPAIASSPCRPTIVLRLRRPAIARVLRRSAIVLGAVLSRAVFGVKLAAGALLVAVVALAIMNYRDPEPAATGVEPADNETVVYRRAAPAHARSEEAKPADQGDEAGSQYPRAVQTVRFVNPDPP